MSGNAAARRFRRKVSCEMQATLPAQPHMPKGGDRGGVGGHVLDAVFWECVWALALQDPFQIL